MNISKTTTRDLVTIALFVALIAVMAQITIPLPYVPLTMQTFAIMLAGVVLGAKRGAIAVCFYLLLGALGAPVFSAFQGGFGMLIGATGGFLLSFPLQAFIAGYVSDRVQIGKKSSKASVSQYFMLGAGLVLAFALNLTAGSLQLALVMQIGIPAAFLAGMIPFIVPELLKALLVLIIAPKIRAVLSASQEAD